MEAGVMEKVCRSEYFYPAGFADGEKVMGLTRVASTLITVSIFSSWYDNPKVVWKLVLFFVHWLR